MWISLKRILLAVLLVAVLAGSSACAPVVGGLGSASAELQGTWVGRITDNSGDTIVMEWGFDGNEYHALSYYLDRDEGMLETGTFSINRASIAFSGELMPLYGDGQSEAISYTVGFSLGNDGLTITSRGTTAILHNNTHSHLCRVCGSVYDAEPADTPSVAAQSERGDSGGYEDKPNAKSNDSGFGYDDSATGGSDSDDDFGDSFSTEAPFTGELPESDADFDTEPKNTGRAVTPAALAGTWIYRYEDMYGNAGYVEYCFNADMEYYRLQYSEGVTNPDEAVLFLGTYSLQGNICSFDGYQVENGRLGRRFSSETEVEVSGKNLRIYMFSGYEIMTRDRPSGLGGFVSDLFPPVPDTYTPPATTPVGNVFFAGLVTYDDHPPTEGIMEADGFTARPNNEGGYDCSVVIYTVSYAMESTITCVLSSRATGDVREFVIAESDWFGKGYENTYNFKVPADMVSSGDCEVLIVYTYW